MRTTGTSLALVSLPSVRFETPSALDISAGVLSNEPPPVRLRFLASGLLSLMCPVAG